MSLKSVKSNKLKALLVRLSLTEGFMRKLGTIHFSTSTNTVTSCSHQASNKETDWKSARPFKKIPGPTKFELVRGFLPGGEFYNKPASDFFGGLRRKYGDFLILPGAFGKASILMSFNPDVYRTVFRNEGIWPERRNFDSVVYFRQVYKKDYFQGVDGLIMSSGESWGRFRTAVNPILMQPKNARQYLSKMLPVNDQFLNRIREIRDPLSMEMPETFEDEIKRLAFESVAVIALDQDLGLINRSCDDQGAEKLFKNLKDFFELAYALDIQPSLWKIIKTPKFYKMMKVSEEIFKITSKYIETALKRIEENPTVLGDTRKKSVLQLLAEKDKLIAIVMAMDMLLAGVDTTTTTLTGILLCIAKNPEKQEKLRNEIESILPTKASKPSLESMNNLPYLRASIKEGIRLYPIQPGTVRKVAKDVVLEGYQVPKGTDVAMASNIVSKEEKYFPRANEFIPERWLRTDEACPYKPKEENPFVYLPFGFGPRSCAGKRIVELELELTIMRLVRNFNIEFNYSTENAFSSQFFSLPVIPLKFKFTEI